MIFLKKVERRSKKTARKDEIVKKVGKILLVLILAAAGYIVITQMTASTPKIKDGEGKVLEGSIAELKKVNLNGRKEWITIRGNDRTAPVLLFLAGGPGGSQFAGTRIELAELEKHFVVVNWDQPGSGKSYSCMKRSDITVQTYIDDGIALTEYLCRELGQEKIYLVGESWGSALGIFLTSEKPEYYAGLIGSGQMVDFKETEVIDYYKALEIAKEKGDSKKIEKLEKLGVPPYYDGNIAIKSSAYLSYLSSYMAANPATTGSPFHTGRDMMESEYGLVDSVRYLLGIMNTFNVVYPQLYETDLRTEYSKLEIPVYFFLGRHDLNAPVSLAEEYFNLLEAPKKELIWFEHSGHTPWNYETDLFVQETLRVFGGMIEE